MTGSDIIRVDLRCASDLQGLAMNTIPAVVLLCVTASTAHALCAPHENIYMACRLNDRDTSLSICFDDTDVHYRYGITNQEPELELTQRLDNVLRYVPSARNGQFVSDEIRFFNGEYVYRVEMGFIIPWDDVPKGDLGPAARFGDPVWGGIDVMRDGEVLSALTCAFDTIDFRQSDMMDAMNVEGVEIWTPFWTGDSDG
jgi:hypothetical protein